VRRLRRRCERRLAGIDVPRPFDLDRFCRHVEHSRGRQLRLQPIPNLTASAPCGMYLSTGEADYVFYESSTSALHVEHIILHELSHVICEHTAFGGAGAGGSTLANLMPNLDPAMIRRVMGRVSYSSEQEKEAEYMASLIRWRGGDRSTVPGASSSVGSRVVEALA
jgi:hypothetical protein